MSNFMTVITISGVILVGIITLGLIFARLYKRSSKEVSFVRTGFGGEKVVLNGGALVFPVLHETIPVNMNTLRLEVRRENDQGLITKDRMRVDCAAEFYVRTKPTKESIAAAAQTLGIRTMNPSQLKELVEGKFVDALRSVAAEMAMKELHEQRVQFVLKVQEAVAEDLLKNGLELESVSLTGLDQTAKEFFNPDNAFDAEGLTRLTEEIESRRKLRNDIEQDTNVAIANKNLEAERQSLAIKREEEYARLDQEREVEVRKAEQSSEIAKQQAEKKREAEEAEITEQKKVDSARISAELEIESQRIQKQRDVEVAEIDRKKAAELAEQDKAIAVSQKSQAESEAKAQADKARQLSVKEEEEVETVKQAAVAERAKRVELIKAEEDAEKVAIGVKVAAEAEKQASNDRAEAIRITAEAEADRVKIDAGAKAEAIKKQADADERRYAVEAEGKRAINEAENQLSEAQIDMQVKMRTIEHLPNIIAESVRPMERIGEIKIYQVDGLSARGNGGENSSEKGSGAGSLADQVTNAALSYRAQAPLVDQLMKGLGIEGSDINGMTSMLGDPSSNKKGTDPHAN